MIFTSGRTEMKRKYLLFALPLLFSFVEKSTPSDRDKYNLEGKVKSMKETRYYAKVTDNEIVKVEISDNSYASYYILFNLQGFITEYHALYPKKSVNTKKIYSYEKDALVQVEEFNVAGEVKAKEVFDYNIKGALSTQSSYRDGKFTEKKSYEYDKQENISSISYKY